MRTARGALLIAFVLLALVAGGCTLQGTGEPGGVLEAPTPTSQAGPATGAPGVIEVTPLGGEPTAEAGDAIEAQSLDDGVEPATATPGEVEPAETATAEPPGEEAAQDERAVALPGDILFVRESQLWRYSPLDGSEASITDLPAGAVIREVAVSPTGQYVAFTVNNSDVTVLDLSTGQTLVVDEAAPDLVSQLTWTPSGSALYYQKTTENPQNIPEAEADGLWHVIYEVPVDPVMAPGPVTAVPESAGSEVSLRFALGDRRLLLSEHPLLAEGVSRLLLLDAGLFPLPVEAFQSIELLDIAPDQTRVLFLDETARLASGPEAPVPLYMATVSDTEGLVDAAVAAAEPDAEYRRAVFAPDGQRIAAVRAVVPSAAGAGEGVVLLEPTADGAMSASELALPEGATFPALVWYGEAGIVVQRVPAEAGPSELWFVPLDGAAATRLGAGEQPAVVPPAGD